MTERQAMPVLSGRLELIGSLVTAGNRVLDIGCDHAYLPITLVAEGTARGAVVCDISEAAVSRARANIEAAHLTQRIEARCADGLQGYRAGECDTLIISGMGGPLILDILERGGELPAGFSEMILSPQSETAMVRRWLSLHGFKLTAERMVRDQNKYYVILKAVPGCECSYAEDAEERSAQYAYGPLLIRGRDGVLADFLQQEIGRYETALEASSHSREPRALRRRAELEAKKEAACRVMKSLTI